MRCYYVSSLTKQLLLWFDFSLKGYASYMYFAVIAAYFLGERKVYIIFQDLIEIWKTKLNSGKACTSSIEPLNKF